jgi:hypothetical protein
MDHPADCGHLRHLKEDFRADFEFVVGAKPKSVLGHVDQDDIGAAAIRLDDHRLAVESDPPFAASVYTRRQIHARRHFGPLVKPARSGTRAVSIRSLRPRRIAIRQDVGEPHTCCPGRQIAVSIIPMVHVLGPVNLHQLNGAPNDLVAIPFTERL